MFAVKLHFNLYQQMKSDYLQSIFTEGKNAPTHKKVDFLTRGISISYKINDSKRCKNEKHFCGHVGFLSCESRDFISMS